MRRINPEEVEEIVNEFKDKLVIVEGKNDEKALKALGLKNIIKINGQPLLDVVNQAVKIKKEIIILTDFDKEGRKLASKLNSLLEAFKRKPNKRLRRMFMKFGKNKIEEVDAHVKISTKFNKIYNKSQNSSRRGCRKTRRYWCNFRPDRRLIRA